MNENKEIDITKVLQVELHFTTHAAFDVAELTNAYHWTQEAKDKGEQVVQFYVKYGTLYMTLANGEMIEEYVSDVEYAFDNVDIKYPDTVMVNVDGSYEEWKE